MPINGRPMKHLHMAHHDPERSVAIYRPVSPPCITLTCYFLAASLRPFYREGVIVVKMMYIVCVLAVGLVFSPALPCAQTEPGTLPQKTIGQGKPQLVPSLIVGNARGPSPQGQTLTR